MELSISDNMNKSKTTDVDEFIKELNETLKKSEGKNELSTNVQKSNNKIDEEPTDIYGHTETYYRHATDEGNFAPQLAKELQLSEADLNILRDKIDNYFKEYSKYCGIISYEGYDMENNQYYLDWYKNGECKRTEYTNKEFAQGCTMGLICRCIPNQNNPRICSAKPFEEVKDAIKFSMEEQLSEGISVKDINLFKLENDIKNNQYLKPLYDKFNEN